MKTETKSPLAELCQSMGLTIKSSEPTGTVEDKWPHLFYQVQLLKGEKLIWSGPYKLGLGHVSLKSVTFGFTEAWTADQEAMLRTWQRKPSAEFVDKELQAQVAAKLARKQKVFPKVDDVVASLVRDGSCHFDSQSFSDWCADLGYSDDSIKAKETYEACEETGRTLKRALRPEELGPLIESAYNH
jgi:hypothetical protein